METLGHSQTTVTMNTYAAGIATGLVSLVGFGLDSGIESIAAVANWRVQSATTPVCWTQQHHSQRSRASYGS